MNCKLILRTFVSMAVLASGLALSGCEIQGTEGGKVVEDFVPPAPVEPYKPTPPAAQTKKFVILHTNDEHSHLLADGPESEYPFIPVWDTTANAGAGGYVLNPGAVAQRIFFSDTLTPLGDKVTVGGLVRRQFLINKTRAESKDPVLVVSAGDSAMGTLFHVASNQLAPDWLSMAFLGYDFVTLGNHEFDFGPDYLAQMINAANRTVFGGSVPVISSNMHFEDVQAGGPGSALKAMVGEGNSGAPIMPYATKVLANGLKVGVIGLMGYEAAMVAPLKGPVQFSVPEGAACTTDANCATGTATSCVRGRCIDPMAAQAHVAAIAADAQPIVDLLRNSQKVNVVIALSHLGVTEDNGLAAMTKGIDVIIGGHSHTELPAPLVVNSALPGGGKSIVVQAGSYGAKLGQLAITVAPDGTVGFVTEDSKLLPVDYRLDAQIYGTSNLTANPPVVSETFHEALALTSALVVPVIDQLNAKLAPALGRKVLDPAGASDHDILGNVAYKDSNLMQFVTDAGLAAIPAGFGIDAASKRIVVVEANGVIRDNLRFAPQGRGLTTTVSDVFRVLPLGASPYADDAVQAPGYPMVTFELSLPELYAGMDVGVTKGLESDSFFLSYAGAKVTYDRNLPPFDAKKLDPMNPQDPGGRITKIEMNRNPFNPASPWDEVYNKTKDANWMLRWTGLNPMAGDRVVVVTNLYIAAFMAQFGMKPKDATGAELTLRDLPLCMTGCTFGSNPEGEPAWCNPAGQAPEFKAMERCATLFDPANPTGPLPAKWKFPEVKEWAVIMKYLGAIAGTQPLPAQMYKGDGPVPVNPRVIDATPAP